MAAVSRSAVRRRLTRPMNHNIMSRSWDFAVNSLASSPLMTHPGRCALYRRAGLHLESNEIYPGCYFHTSDFHLGPESLLNRGVFVENTAPVRIGTATALASQVMLITSSHRFGPPERRAGEWTYEPIVIGDGCWIGARAMILAGVTVGDGCVVAAGAVVTEACAANGLYGGIPARRIRDL